MYAKSVGGKLTETPLPIVSFFRVHRSGTALYCPFTDTKTIVRYFFSMKPGTDVFVLNPRLHGYIGDTNTALITTNRPLIPHSLNSPTTNSLPKPVTGNEDYSHFNFITDSLPISKSTFYILGMRKLMVPCSISQFIYLIRLKTERNTFW